MAKIGDLFLNRGQLNGRRILSRQCVRPATSGQIDADGGGIRLWMVELSRRIPGFFLGKGTQRTGHHGLVEA
jgi:hypothetical protein